MMRRCARLAAVTPTLNRLGDPCLSRMIHAGPGMQILANMWAASTRSVPSSIGVGYMDPRLC